MPDSKLTPKKSLTQVSKDSYNLQKFQTGISLSNLYVSSKSLESLKSIEANQQEMTQLQAQMTQLQAQLLNVNYQQLDYLEQIAAQGKEKDTRDKLALREKQMRASHKELIFNFYSDLADFEEDDLDIAEKYYRTRSMVYSLESSGITTESFDDINDKLFFDKINKKVSKITEEAESSNDPELIKFVAAVEQFFYANYKPAYNANTVSEELKLKRIEAEKKLINKFIKGFEENKFSKISELDPPETQLPRVLKHLYVSDVLKMEGYTSDRELGWFFNESCQSYKKHLWMFFSLFKPAVRTELSIDMYILNRGNALFAGIGGSILVGCMALLMLSVTPEIGPIGFALFLLFGGGLWLLLKQSVFPILIYWKEYDGIDYWHIDLCKEELDKLDDQKEEIIEDIYKVSKGKEDYLEMQRSAENNLKSFAGKFPFLKKLFQDL